MNLNLKADFKQLSKNLNSMQRTQLPFVMSKTINERTFQVTCASEIEESWFINCEKVGISAGASTPDYLIEEVAKKIEKINK